MSDPPAANPYLGPPPAAPRSGHIYAFWCFVATVNALYGCAWVCSHHVRSNRHDTFVSQDFLMDWSLLEPHARYPILRRELVYKSHVSVRPQVSITLMALTVSQCYYFAIVRSRNRPDHGSNDKSSSQVFNVFVRFFWLRYIFVNKAHTTQDMFISALLEVLRRVQWNICTSFASPFFSLVVVTWAPDRLESSHIKNIEQHHVIREVRLPYSVGAQSNNKARVTPARWRQQATP